MNVCDTSSDKEQEMTQEDTERNTRQHKSLHQEFIPLSLFKKKPLSLPLVSLPSSLILHSVSFSLQS